MCAILHAWRNTLLAVRTRNLMCCTMGQTCGLYIKLVVTQRKTSVCFMAASCHRDPVRDEKHCKGQRIGSGLGLRGIKCHSGGRYGSVVVWLRLHVSLQLGETGSRDGKTRLQTSRPCPPETHFLLLSSTSQRFHNLPE